MSQRVINRRHNYSSVKHEKGDKSKNSEKKSDKTVREIMTPRVDITALLSSASLDDAMDLISSKQFSKIPIYKDSIDEIDTRNSFGIAEIDSLAAEWEEVFYLLEVEKEDLLDGFIENKKVIEVKIK